MTDPGNGPHPHDVAELAALAEKAPRSRNARLRALIFIGENLVVVLLLAWWLIWGRHGHVNGYLVVFLYCFPSEFLVAPVPHEPVLIYFGKLLGPMHVAIVSRIGTLITEALNYHTFAYIADARPLQRVLNSPVISKAVDLFDRRPFLALCLAGFAPIPFYPFRFLVVLARYPLPRFLLAVVVSRLPRFYLLALLGRSIPLSDRTYLALFAILVLMSVLPFLPLGRWAAWLRRLVPGRTPVEREVSVAEVADPDGEIGKPVEEC